MSRRCSRSASTPGTRAQNTCPSSQPAVGPRLLIATAAASSTGVWACSPAARSTIRCTSRSTAVGSRPPRSTADGLAATGHFTARALAPGRDTGLSRLQGRRRQVARRPHRHCERGHRRRRCCGVTEIIHCSLGGWTNYGDAIRATAPTAGQAHADAIIVSAGPPHRRWAVTSIGGRDPAVGQRERCSDGDDLGDRADEAVDYMRA